MTVETKRLKIYTASAEEMTAYIEKQTDAELIKAYNEMLEGAVNDPGNFEWYAIWMIGLKNGTHIGDLSFKGLCPDGSVEIGYGIDKIYRRCGYASEAVEAVSEWALLQPEVTRVEAETDPGNKASMRVLEKCGFIPTGTFGEEGPRYVKKH